jgi:hypothetical protein
MAVMGEGGASWSNGFRRCATGMEFTMGYRKTLASGLGIDINGNLRFLPQPCDNSA